VDDRFFELFDVPVLAGRGFDVADLDPGRATVIINRTFAQQIAGDGNPSGRRVRYLRRQGGPVAEAEPWYDIVGVVDDLPANTDVRRMYHPLAADVSPVSLAVRMESASPGLPRRLRETAAGLDPALRLHDVGPLDAIYRQYQRTENILAYLVAAAMLSVLVLSAAGIYALMSFTVSQRRREIGIRSALGAQPARLLVGILSRALWQVATGAAVGLLAALLLDRYVVVESAGANIPGVVPVATLMMVVIGLLAATGPARHGLRVDPSDALRDG
jgi:hypothetical protein